MILYSEDLAFLTMFRILFDANVVSNAKSDFSEINLSILFNNIFPASIETDPGLKGDNAFAIASAFIYSLHFKISGNTSKEEVVLPVPFDPVSY